MKETAPDGKEYIREERRGATDGVASLDGSGKVPDSELDSTIARSSQLHSHPMTGALSNGYGARTVSTNAPSGGSNGDVWMQIEET